MRSVSISMLALGAAACATGGSGPALIMDPSIPLEVRQAATCYLFNDQAPVYLSGVQLDMYDYAEAADFWDARFERIEGDDAIRERMLESGRAKMAQDFEPAPANLPANVQRFEAGYATVIQTCLNERAVLDPEQERSE